MTVVLWDIDEKKRRNSHIFDNKPIVDWSVEDYHTVARRCICAFAVPQLAERMLRDDDAISFFAEQLMYAACRWRDYPGGRTVRAYLNQCVIWNLPRWVGMLKSAKSTVSLNDNGDDHTSYSQSFSEIIADDKAQTPDNIMVGEERTKNLAHVIANASLTDRQRYCVDAVYVQGQRPAEVARQLGIRRQAVANCLTNGIRKIQVAINDQESLFT